MVNVMCGDIITPSLEQAGRGGGRKGGEREWGERDALRRGNIFPLLSPRQTLQGEHVSFSPLRKEEETEAQSGHVTCQALTDHLRQNLTLALPGFCTQTQCACLCTLLPTRPVITQPVSTGCPLH